MPRNTRPLRYTQQYQINPNYTNRKYWYERYNAVNPTVLTTAAGLTALPTAAAAQVDRLHTSYGRVFEYYQTTAQTLQPIGNTKGMVIDGDQVDNESQEYVPGGNSSTSAQAFVVGTDTDFFIRAVLEITDASGSDQLVVGFRKQEAFLVPTSFLTGGAAGYTDFAAMGFCATKANPNPVGCVTSVASAANVQQALSFTWADTLVHELQVRVVGRRVKYLINGVEAGNTVSKDALGNSITAQNTISAPAYSFTSALTVVPFIFVRQDADLTDTVFLRELEIGHLVDAGKDPNQE